MKNPVPSAKKRLLIIGAVHIDDIAKPESALVPLASNPVRWSQHIGGVAANAACSAARTIDDSHSLSVEFLAAVGDDANATRLVQTLNALNVKTQFKQFEHAVTGRYTAVMNYDGELYIGLSDVSLAEELTESMVDELTDWSGVAAVLLDANLSQQCLLDISSVAARHNVPVAAMSVSPVKTQRLLALAENIDLLFCNRREASAMLSHADNSASLDTLADGLSALGFSNMILTDGHSPVLVRHGGETTHISVKHIECTHHVNGAGDALAGATFVAWANGMNLAESLEKSGLPASAHIVTGRYQPPMVGNPADRNPV